MVTPTGEGGRMSDPDGGGGWVGIAANAHSGMGRGRVRVGKLVDELENRGIEAKVAWSAEDRGSLVDEAGRDPKCRCLVAAGGDGTVAALLNESPGVPITVLPAGTENLFARHFRLGSRPERLASAIAEGRVEPLDLGLAGSRRFALMAGFGFDADVVTRHHHARIGQSGRMRPTHRVAYVDPVLRASFGYRFPALKVEIDDEGNEETLIGTSVFVFNLPRYALGLPFAPTARGDDGLLDLVVFRDPGPWRALYYLGLVALGQHLRSPSVSHRRVRRLRISATSPVSVPVQLDGDPGGIVSLGDGHAPWTFEVLPAAVGVVVPEGYAGRPKARIPRSLTSGAAAQTMRE